MRVGQPGWLTSRKGRPPTGAACRYAWIVIKVAEINGESTVLAIEAMLALRPQWRSPDELVAVIDTELRPTGYRLVGVSGTAWLPPWRLPVSAR